MAYATDSPVAGYYVAQHGDQFQLAGQVIDPILEGIVVPCGKEDCTTAPLTEVGKAVETAFTQHGNRWHLPQDPHQVGPGVFCRQVTCEKNDGRPERNQLYPNYQQPGFGS